MSKFLVPIVFVIIFTVLSFSVISAILIVTSDYKTTNIDLPDSLDFVFDLIFDSDKIQEDTKVSPSIEPSSPDTLYPKSITTIVFELNQFNYTAKDPLHVKGKITNPDFTQDVFITVYHATNNVKIVKQLTVPQISPDGNFEIDFTVDYLDLDGAFKVSISHNGVSNSKTINIVNVSGSQYPENVDLKSTTIQNIISDRFALKDLGDPVSVAIGELNGDGKFLQYGIEPDKSLRVGVQDCIVKEDDKQVAVLFDCWIEHFPEIINLIQYENCPRTHTNDEPDLAWFPKECVYVEINTDSEFLQQSNIITINMNEEYSIADESKIILKKRYVETGYVDPVYDGFIAHYGNSISRSPGFIDINSGLLSLESPVIIVDGEKSYYIENNYCKTEMGISGDVGYMEIVSCDYSIKEQPFSQLTNQLQKIGFTKELELVNEKPQKLTLYENEGRFLTMNYYGLGPFHYDSDYDKYTFDIPIDIVTNYGLKNITISHLPGEYEETFQIGPDEIHLKLINAEQHNERGTKFRLDKGIFHIEVSVKTIDDPEKYPLRILQISEVNCSNLNYWAEKFLSWTC